VVLAARSCDCSEPAGSGDLESLQWARESGCPWHFGRVFCEALRSGYLPLLQWLWQQRQHASNAARAAEPAWLTWEEDLSWDDTRLDNNADQDDGFSPLLEEESGNSPVEVVALLRAITSALGPEAELFRGERDVPPSICRAAAALGTLAPFSC
jgi:hypothetical protein